MSFLREGGRGGRCEVIGNLKLQEIFIHNFFDDMFYRRIYPPPALLSLQDKIEIAIDFQFYTNIAEIHKFTLFIASMK